MKDQATSTITIYTSGPRCVDCNTIKHWLGHNGYSYTERNIRDDPAALEELSRLGYQSVPVTVIGGQAIDGLEMDAIKAALGHSS